MPLKKKTIRVLVRRPRRLARQGRGVRSRMFNPQPTFTETFNLARDNLSIVAGTSLGKVFKVAFNNIPQWPQYMNLYNQYKINWVKVMLVPSFDTNGADINSAQATPLGQTGMARIVYAINDTPGEETPLSEAEVLSDNGAKIRSIGTKWSCSFKPVADIGVQALAGTSVIPTKIKKQQWFSFDATTLSNNPAHGAVSAYITLPGSVGATMSVGYTCYYKVNFSLRDPK